MVGMLDRRGFLGAMGALSMSACGGEAPESAAEAPAEPAYDHFVYFGTYTRDGDLRQPLRLETDEPSMGPDRWFPFFEMKLRRVR